jgi:2-haloacid dehalogenase
VAAGGPRFDLGSALTAASGALGQRAEALGALWRQKQLEYSWLRSLMGRHADFWTVTGDALDYALARFGIEAPDIRAKLMGAYLALRAYPEVTPVLQALQRLKLRAAILSNGSPSMLAAVVSTAAIGPLLHDIISVEDVGVFKPHPTVYQRAVDRLGVTPDAICFLSANGWDIAGAASFGFRTVWVNRAGAPPERLPAGAAAEISDLGGLLALLPAAETG